MTPQLTPEQREQFAQDLYAGRKIAAIKRLRELSGLGLAEAKEIIDRLEADLRAANPERFTAPRKNGCTVTATAGLFVVIGVVLLFFLLRR